MKKLVINLIKLYQRTFSAVTQPRCRFYPTCSQYAIEAIEFRGVTVGLYLAVVRILKCHPFHKGGVDLIGVKK